MRRSTILAAALSGFLLLGGATGCSQLDALFGGDQATKTITVQTVISACDAYQLALDTAASLAAAKLLSAATIAKINAIRPPLNHICPPEGQMPTGPIDAIVTVTVGTAQIIAAFKGAQ